MLIVFAKAPQPGAVKTRLAPLLGHAGAASLHARLVEHTLATARASGLHPLELHCAPAIGDAFLNSCAARFGATAAAQSGRDLGERMRNAFERALAAAPWAILIGTDCPALTAQHLHDARAALAAENDAVFVPTEDGGYALIGLARCDDRLFEDIAWGEAAVMSATRAKLVALGWRWRELATLWDVDRPADYLRLASSGLIMLAQADA